MTKKRVLMKSRFSESIEETFQVLGICAERRKHISWSFIVALDHLIIEHKEKWPKTGR